MSLESGPAEIHHPSESIPPGLYLVASPIGHSRHSDDLIDEIPIAGMALSKAVADQGVEGGGSVAPAVPAEHEFVKMALQVFPAQAMERAESPSLEVRKDPVDPGHHQMGGPVADNLPGVFAAI